VEEVTGGGGSDGEDDECEDDPGSDKMDVMAALADGTINANPTRIKAAFWFAAYTSFHMIQPPNPIRTVSLKPRRMMLRHFTSPCSLPYML